MQTWRIAYVHRWKYGVMRWLLWFLCICVCLCVSNRVCESEEGRSKGVRRLSDQEHKNVQKERKLESSLIFCGTITHLDAHTHPVGPRVTVHSGVRRQHSQKEERENTLVVKIISTIRTLQF